MTYSRKLEQGNDSDKTFNKYKKPKLDNKAEKCCNTFSEITILCVSKKVIFTYPYGILEIEILIKEIIKFTNNPLLIFRKVKRFN